ncbi:hypothetical protein BDN72DRAFT_905273 [Pluteus cervinus]|uniref:Uncharacterized protein n=1 Tax=Pluteus cervinus TaxID=181527 RepID=A0ACD3A3B9_9AGAR|nr:hypothetical protein BDN72DRAFT_905273 [Pluteus cervinus]
MQPRQEDSLFLDTDHHRSDLEHLQPRKAPSARAHKAPCSRRRRLRPLPSPTLVPRALPALFRQRPSPFFFLHPSHRLLTFHLSAIKTDLSKQPVSAPFLQMIFSLILFVPFVRVSLWAQRSEGVEEWLAACIADLVRAWFGQHPMADAAQRLWFYFTDLMHTLAVIKVALGIFVWRLTTDLMRLDGEPNELDLQ